MIKLLKYITSDIFVFIGTIILIVVIGEAVTNLIQAIVELIKKK